MATAVIVQATPDSEMGFECYGAAREFWRYKGPECILAGPYETGKTIAALYKLHTLLAKYPKSRALMVRKTYKSLVASVVVTFEQKVLPKPPGDPKCPMTKYGGERPDFYAYPNGSRLMVGGMDNADKFLSAEFDFIYINQAEELSLDDWEKLTGRATGRAGNAPYAQVMGDCNPGPPRHWIRQRDRLKLFKSHHEDNPTLFTREGDITEQGARTMETLNALTGVRYKRGRLGQWAGQEGMVYEEWNEDVHLIDPFPIPDSWRRYRAIDFGYTNPFVCQWWAEDEDGRLYLYREIYMSRRTVKVHAQQINELSGHEWYGATVADHDASDRATLAENGITTVAAQKDVSVGIEKVQERLKVQGDNRPRLFIMRDALVETDHNRAEKRQTLCTLDEFDGYIYPDSKEGRSSDENPVKNDDHGMDPTRYITMYLDGEQSQGGTFSPSGKPL